MGTDEIRCVLRIFPQFDDAYSIDTIPPHLNGLLVCNLDPSDCPVSHWVAIYVDAAGYWEYFDSVGRAPMRCKQVDFYFCALRSNGLMMR